MSLTECKRIEALRSYQILDTPEDDAFGDIVEFASTVCATPIALVSLVDDERQWFKAKVGLEVAQTPKDVAFCARAIDSNKDLFVVPDARVDPRFKNNPLVLQEPHVVFYAGAPLVTEDGYKLGTLCVIDHKPRVLSVEKQRMLVLLSRQVSQLIELRRNKIDRELRAAEMERLIEKLPSGLYKWSIDDSNQLRFKGGNAAAKSLFGTDHSMYLGMTYEDVLSTWGIQLHTQESLDVANNGGSFEYETPYRRVDGADGVLSVVYFQAAPGTMISLFQDVSNARIRERELAEAHRMLRLMTDGSTDAFWHRPDPGTEVLKWSDRVTDLLGHDPDSEALSAKGILELLHPDERAANTSVFNSAIESCVPFDLECRIANVSGEYRWFRVRGTPYIDGSGELRELAGSISPIDRMIGLQQDLQSSNLKLEQFAYQISHDFKAPLVSARRMCQVILEDLDLGDLAEVRRNIDVMSNQMTVLENLVRGLLSFIYAESGQEQREPVSFVLLIEEIKTSLTDWLDSESVSLTHSIDVEGILLLESLRIKQVLKNLIFNGIKYRSNERTDCLVHVNVTSGVGDVLISVIDNGCGIPKTHHDRVFNTFTRFHPDTVGSGLGLAIVKQHVDAMNGEVTFTSNRLGTKFDVTIPVPEL